MRFTARIMLLSLNQGFGKGRFLSTLLQADKAQEATRTFSIAATTLLQLTDIPLPLSFAKDTGHSQFMVSDSGQNQWNQWISSVIDYVQFENHNWALEQIKSQNTLMDSFILILEHHISIVGVCCPVEQ